MSSTAVAERPRLKIASYLADLIRRARPGEPALVEQDVPPFAPESSFVTADDEVLECES
jgi:hypothetical protein